MPGPPPPVARVRSAVRDLVAGRRAAGALDDAGPVLVACSGGPDSIALASQTAFLAARGEVRAGAVVVDHGLQPGSEETAARAARLCADLGLDPVLVRRVDPPGRPTETDARAARRGELLVAVAELGAAGLLLGHTLDDQAEGVLLALGRGSGTRAVSGMAAVDGVWWRPLLGVRRADTHAVCHHLGLPVAHDPTNAVAGPWRRGDGGPVPRAAVRERVLGPLADALGRDPAPALARTAELARQDADLLDVLAAAAWERCRAAVGRGSEDEADARRGAQLLDAVRLAAEPAALRTRVLRAAATAAGSPAGDLGRTHVDALDALVVDWHGQGEAALPGGVVGRRRCGRLVLDPPR